VGGGSGGTGEDTAEADGAGAEPSTQLETKSSALVRINALLLDGEEIPVEMDEEVLLRNEAVPRNWAARARRLMASKPKLESLEVRVSGGGAPRPETPPSFVCVTAAVSRVLMVMLWYGWLAEIVAVSDVTARRLLSSVCVCDVLGLSMLCQKLFEEAKELREHLQELTDIRRIVQAASKW
jgi:hypothetical protein